LILDAVDTLEEPVSVWKNVLNLKNHAYQYRMRVGRYRILFDFDGSVQVVEIQEVRKRDERTY
jgi:mRNA-degrading endonuclease RelE of RelBE toxin-antitoxin system